MPIDRRARLASALLSASVCAAAGPVGARASHVQVVSADTVFVAITPLDTVVTPGAEFDVHLRVTRPGKPFNAYDAIIEFDPAALTFVPRPQSVQEGSSMRDACHNTFHVFHAAGDSLSINHSLLCQGLSLPGPATLYNLRFRASTTVQLTSVQLRFVEFYNAGLFVRPVVTTNSMLHIGAPVGVMAPPAAGVLRLAAVPNPFNPTTVLHVEVGASGSSSLVVRDAAGRTVRWLEREVFPAGQRRVTWDGCDESGVRVSSGVYFVTLENMGRSVSERVVLLK